MTRTGAAKLVVDAARDVASYIIVDAVMEGPRRRGLRPGPPLTYAVYRLSDALATYDAATDWQDIATAPKDGTPIMIGDTGWAEPASWHDGSENYWKRAGWYALEDRGCLLTAKPLTCRLWCPLPSPPSQEQRP